MPYANVETRRLLDRMRVRRYRDARRPRGASHCHLDGYLLTQSVDAMGRLSVACVACERRRNRVCMDCGAPCGEKWRCPRHQAAALKRAQRMFQVRHRGASPRRYAIRACRLCGRDIPYRGRGAPQWTCDGQGRCARAGVLA